VAALGQIRSLNTATAPEFSAPESGHAALPSTSPTVATGADNVSVTVKPNTLSFEYQLVGTRSTAKTVTFTNEGDADVYFTKINLQGVDADQFGFTTTCGINGSGLPPGASCTSTTYYIPTFPELENVFQICSGNFTQQEVSISGIGTAVVIKPKALTFPRTIVGDTSAPKTIVFKNVGPAALPIDSVNWIDTEPYFSQTNDCGSSIPPQSSCTFSVTFSPLTAGTFTATLSIEDPDPTGPQRITVTGTGIATAAGTK
jgi:ASPM-SPD-2-Hydin domain-containing protein